MKTYGIPEALDLASGVIDTFVTPFAEAQRKVNEAAVTAESGYFDSLAGQLANAFKLKVLKGEIHAGNLEDAIKEFQSGLETLANDSRFTQGRVKEAIKQAAPLMASNLQLSVAAPLLAAQQARSEATVAEIWKDTLDDPTLNTETRYDKHSRLLKQWDSAGLISKAKFDEYTRMAEDIKEYSSARDSFLAMETKTPLSGLAALQDEKSELSRSMRISTRASLLKDATAQQNAKDTAFLAGYKEMLESNAGSFFDKDSIEKIISSDANKGISLAAKEEARTMTGKVNSESLVTLFKNRYSEERAAAIQSGDTSGLQDLLEDIYVENELGNGSPGYVKPGTVLHRNTGDEQAQDGDRSTIKKDPIIQPHGKFDFIEKWDTPELAKERGTIIDGILSTIEKVNEANASAEAKAKLLRIEAENRQLMLGLENYRSQQKTFNAKGELVEPITGLELRTAARKSLATYGNDIKTIYDEIMKATEKEIPLNALSSYETIGKTLDSIRAQAIKNKDQDLLDKVGWAERQATRFISENQGATESVYIDYFHKLSAQVISKELTNKMTRGELQTDWAAWKQMGKGTFLGNMGIVVNQDKTSKNMPYSYMPGVNADGWASFQEKKAREEYGIAVQGGAWGPDNGPYDGRWIMQNGKKERFVFTFDKDGNPTGLENITTGKLVRSLGAIMVAKSKEEKREKRNISTLNLSYEPEPLKHWGGAP